MKKYLFAFIGLALLMAWLANRSIEMPYLPAHSVVVFLDWVLPVLLYVPWMIIFFFIPIKGRTVATYTKGLAKGLGHPPRFMVVVMVFGSGILCVSFGYICKSLLAWPTEYFSHRPDEFIVDVRKTRTIGNTLGRWSKIVVTDKDGLSSEFAWKSTDIEAKHVKAGDKLRIVGRTWAVGTYVEAWVVTK